MDASFYGEDRGKIYIHDWDGIPPDVILNPPEDVRDCTVRIGKVEIVLFKKEEKDEQKQGACPVQTER
jgi:hypothetical protein